MLDVCYRPCNREVHGAKIGHQALQLLLADVVLCGRDGKQLVHILKFSLGEGYCSGFCVGFPPQDFVHTGPVALPCLELLHSQ